jgi:hypothetical protein
VIDENVRVALAAHKEIDNSGHHTHIQDLRRTSGQYNLRDLAQIS